MLKKVVYLFDENKYFCGTDVLFENPKRPGSYFERDDYLDEAPEGDLSANWFKAVDGHWVAEHKPTCAAECVGMVVSHTSMTARDCEARELIKKFSQEEGFREKRGNDLSWSIEKIPEKTEAEKLEEAEQAVRAKRDGLISATDYLLASDYPISAKDLEVVKAYRQALRDVPQQEGFPLDIVWPELPSILANK